MDRQMERRPTGQMAESPVGSRAGCRTGGEERARKPGWTQWVLSIAAIERCVVPLLCVVLDSTTWHGEERGTSCFPGQLAKLMRM
jgi:hypothetical protein